MTTKDEVKALWKLCFDDSDEFTDLYFSMRYKDEINMAIREDGKIVSALQMIPYPMAFCGEVISTSYISGACTHPGYRAHGAMRQLLKETHRRMYEEGVLLSSLIPAEEWLFGYYGKSGYAPAFGYAVEQESDGLRLHLSSSDYRIEVCTSPDAAHYPYFDSRMRQRESCMLHTQEDFEVIMADLKLSGGRLLVAYQNDRIMGMAFTVRGGETLYIKELLADNDAVKRSLLQEAFFIYKVRAMEYIVPSSSNALFLGMARLIHVEKVLSLFARKYPMSAWYIHLEDDEVIPENNGYYTVKDGICLREHLPEKEYQTYTLASLASLLVEAEHPYMSLMLN